MPEVLSTARFKPHNFCLYQVDGSAHGLSIKLRTSLKRIADNLIQHVSGPHTKLSVFFIHPSFSVSIYLYSLLCIILPFKTKLRNKKKSLLTKVEN